MVDKSVDELKALVKSHEEIQTELDRRIFHLKTLYDVSKDIFGSVETPHILRNTLLACTGNFGAISGSITLFNSDERKITHFSSIGLDEYEKEISRKNATRIIIDSWDGALPTKSFKAQMECDLPFIVSKSCRGVLSLGQKIIQSHYDNHDRELLDTIVNNLVTALNHAVSYEQIQNLNKNLKEKNDELEEMLNQLKIALRKIQILESVKANLSKFVPTTVMNILDKSPLADIPEGKEQDVSILFIDIEGYTRLCEKLGSAKVGQIIEKCFSVFMNAIYENEGDVNETAGDGLMVLFLNEDKSVNATQAIRTAIRIKEEAGKLRDEWRELPEKIIINMGINSGTALVGAARFESYTGSRWTYTARGSVTNIAARLGALAIGGQICVSRDTCQRLSSKYDLKHMGKFKLKNVSEEIDVYDLIFQNHISR